MIIYALALLIAALWLVIVQYSTPHRLANDTIRYQAMAQGKKVMRPWNLRIIVPLLFGRITWLWRSMTMLCLVLIAPVLVWFLKLQGIGDMPALIGVLFYLGCAGIVHFNVEYPYLVDAQAMLLSLISACLFLSDMRYIAFLVALLAVLTKETSPVFIALFSWSIYPLLVLVIPIALLLLMKKVDEDIIFGKLYRPNQWFKQGKKELTNPKVMLLPWGLLLLLALLAPSWQLGLALAVGYGQIVVASDRMRLYQQVFPVVILCAVSAPIALGWFLPVAIMNLYNPFADLPN